MPEERARPVLVTRPLEAARETADALAEDGIEALIWPLTRIVPAGTGLSLPPGTDALLVTSAHGIRAFAALEPRRDLPVLTVGAKTAAISRGLGFAATLSADGDAEALAALARATSYRRLFYPRGREVSADLAALIGPGRAVTEAVLYAAEPAGPPPAPVAHALARGGVSAVGVWSRRHAEVLAGHLAAGLPADFSTARLVAISAKAAGPLAESGFGDIRVAAAPDMRAMLAALLDAADG